MYPRFGNLSVILHKTLTLNLALHNTYLKSQLTIIN